MRKPTWGSLTSPSTEADIPMWGTAAVYAVGGVVLLLFVVSLFTGGSSGADTAAPVTTPFTEAPVTTDMPVTTEAPVATSIPTSPADVPVYHLGRPAQAFPADAKQVILTEASKLAGTEAALSVDVIEWLDTWITVVVRFDAASAAAGRDTVTVGVEQAAGGWKIRG